MNEFDNFVNEREQAIKRAENHIADLRKMETIDFMNLKPRLSETELRIQTFIFLGDVEALTKIDMDIEKKAKRICELSKAYEDTVK